MKGDVVWLPYCFAGRGVKPGRKSLADVWLRASVAVPLPEIDRDKAPLVAELPLPIRRLQTGQIIRPILHRDAPDGVTREQFASLVTAGAQAGGWPDYPLQDHGEHLPADPFDPAVIDGQDTWSAERGVAEGYARAAAVGLCVDRGIVWRAAGEPVLTVGPSARGMRGPATISLSLSPSTDMHKVNFRLDGIDRAEATAAGLVARYGMAKGSLPKFRVHRPDLLHFDETADMAASVIRAVNAIGRPTLHHLRRDPDFARLAEVAEHWGPNMDPAAVLAPAARLLLKQRASAARDILQWLHHDGLACAKFWILDWARTTDAARQLVDDDEAALNDISGGP